MSHGQAHRKGLKRQSAQEVVVGKALRRRIPTMQLAPGAVLDQVAPREELGLSRPPVREPMRQMADEGYMDLDANRPARVTSMSYPSQFATRILPGRADDRRREGHARDGDRVSHEAFAAPKGVEVPAASEPSTASDGATHE
jgi:DNA-binding FadR family transcriptional regulator